MIVNFTCDVKGGGGEQKLMSQWAIPVNKDTPVKELNYVKRVKYRPN